MSVPKEPTKQNNKKSLFCQGLPSIPASRHGSNVQKEAPHNQAFHITWLGKDLDNIRRVMLGHLTR